MQKEAVAQQEAEALVDGRRGGDKRQCNNQLDNIDKRGHWQQMQQQLCSYATINKKERVKDALVVFAGGGGAKAHLAARQLHSGGGSSNKDDKAKMTTTQKQQQRRDDKDNVGGECREQRRNGRGSAAPLRVDDDNCIEMSRS